MATAINNYQPVRKNIVHHLNLTKSSQPTPLHVKILFLKLVTHFFEEHFSEKPIQRVQLKYMKSYWGKNALGCATAPTLRGYLAFWMFENVKIRVLFPAKHLNYAAARINAHLLAGLPLW